MKFCNISALNITFWRCKGMHCKFRPVGFHIFLFLHNAPDVYERFSHYDEFVLLFCNEFTLFPVIFSFQAWFLWRQKIGQILHKSQAYHVAIPTTEAIICHDFCLYKSQTLQVSIPATYAIIFHDFCLYKSQIFHVAIPTTEAFIFHEICLYKSQTLQVVIPTTEALIFHEFCLYKCQIFHVAIPTT